MVMTVRAPHALRGWWRYSRLTPLPIASTTIITAAWWWIAAVLPGHRPAFIVVAAVFSELVLRQLVYSAVNSERARRYGCW